MIRFAIQAVSLVLLMLAPDATRACSCLEPDDAAVSFGEAGLVVAATATTVSRESTPLPRSGRELTVSTQVVQWEVAETWKGPYGRDQSFTTRTIVMPGMCGRPVEVGDVLLLYLYDSEPYRVSMCSRTSDLTRLLEDVPILYRLRDSASNGK